MTISICVPTYNGEGTLEKTLDSIVLQILPEFEVVISDDFSRDNTFNVAKRYAAKYNFIKIYRNESNLGMDRNFYQTVTHASGEYVWFCGQDDILCPRALLAVSEILDKYKNVGMVYLNFSQYDHEMKNCITSSMFDLVAQHPEIITKKKELLMDSARSFFENFKHAPTFLPSIIMLRNYWQDVRARYFYGTHYVQTGLILLHLNDRPTAAINEPLVKGRVPEDQWQSDGNKLISIMSGNLLMKKIAFSFGKDYLPQHVYHRDYLRYLLNFPFLVFHSKNTGLNVSEELIKIMKKIFKKNIVLYLYIFPILFCPQRLLKFFISPGKLFKNILFKIKTFQNLRY